MLALGLSNDASNNEAVVELAPMELALQAGAASADTLSVQVANARMPALGRDYERRILPRRYLH